MPGLTEIRLFLSHAGPRTAFATFRYTLKRRKWDRQSPLPAPNPLQAEFRTPGRLMDVTERKGGASWVFESAALEAVFLAPDLLRISWEPGLPPVPYALETTHWPAPAVRLAQAHEGCILESALATLHILPDGSMTFSNPSGGEIRTLSPPKFTQTKRGPAWTDTALLRPHEHLFGLGEHTGSLNLSGRSFTFWNSDPSGSYGPGDDPIYMTLPVFMGIHAAGSYLVFYENYSRGGFSADPAGASHSPDSSKLSHIPTAQIAFSEGMLRSYFILGEPPRLLERFTQLTGRPPLPPRWSLGYHHSRWGYKSEADIREVVDGFQKLDLPLSAIHLDIDYMDGYRVFTIDPTRFPDLKRLAADLGSKGIRLVTIIDPGVKCDPNYDVYAQGSAVRRFCYLEAKDGASESKEFRGVVWPGWCAFPDFTHPAARLWWSGLYPSLLDQGVAGIWHDMNEPSSFTFDGANRFPVIVQHDLDGSPGDHLQAHNLYALLMNRAGFEGLRQARPSTRPWIFSRSGWVSQQRYAWNWTGDIESTWEALRMTVSIVISCGLSGLPYNGSDIGGFSGHPSPELYLRWFQAAALMPFFRTHSAQNVPRREPWSYGEPYTSQIRSALRLRSRLLPYLYTLAWEASRSGAPLVRPLFWAGPQEPRLWSIDDAFMVGDALLVAPILSPGETSRLVTLPSGEWVHFYTDTFYAGFAEVQVDCGLENIPLFVRSGSILPLETETGIELHAYLPSRAKEPVVSRWFVDSGEGYDESCLVEFTLELDGEDVLIRSHRSGNQPLFQSPVRLKIHGSLRRAVKLNGSILALDSDSITL